MLKKIIVVDDSEPLHQIYKVTLKRYRGEVITVSSREEGLKILTEHPDVDLLLADLNMPLSRMSGLEFIKKIKKQEAYAHVPVIVMTTRGKTFSEESLAYAVGNLVKPFTSNEIHALIEKVFPEALSA